MPPTDDTQDARESVARELPLSKAVLDRTEIIRTPGGAPIAIGFMDESRMAKVAGRPEDRQYESLRRAVMHRHEVTGVEPATILNFLPIPLVVNSPMQDLRVRIAPAPAVGTGADEFSFHVWRYAAIEVMERGENIKQPWDYMPRMIAKAFLDEYASFGGVVLLRGIPDAKTLAMPDVVEDIAQAREQMNAWMISKVEEANGEWNTPSHSGSRNIVELHRVCATRLKDLGLIDQLPEWIVASRNMKDVAKRCPVCAVQPNPGAARCVCSYVLDPLKAFMEHDITEEDASLERLTRLQVEELGISAYVAETSDERPARLKRAAPKPLSVAQQNARVAELAAGAGGVVPVLTAL